MTFEEFQALRVETNDIISSIPVEVRDEFDIDPSDMYTNVGYVYPYNGFYHYIEKVDNGFWAMDGSTHGGFHGTLESAEIAYYEFEVGEGEFQ